MWLIVQTPQKQCDRFYLSHPSPRYRLIQSSVCALLINSFIYQCDSGVFVLESRRKWRRP